MPIYTKESIETLKSRIDLIEVISPVVDLKRAGSCYKGLCPFHEEKTPSFMIQQGESHYHCFGCAAHGDAIHFLMNYQRYSFREALEYLAEKFHVRLEQTEGEIEAKGPSKKVMREALMTAANFFHFYLLHTPQGHKACQYLFERDISLDFIRQFLIGLSPEEPGIVKKILSEKRVSKEVMFAVGLLTERGFDCFTNRITFPIQDSTGAVIGFSARKFQSETFGGKYINTKETPLFKKSRILFGLNHSRRRIAKERIALIVEGQIDALRLIYEGLNFTVAAQGTAFGKSHAEEFIRLGVSQIFLALDSDEAGASAAVKIGNFFQQEGVEVRVLSLPFGKDPDSFVRERGILEFKKYIDKSQSYLEYLIDFHSKTMNIATPEGKNALVQLLTKQIRSWNHSFLIHENLKKLSQLLQIPEHMIGVGIEYSPNIYIKTQGNIGSTNVNVTQILEFDFLRWLLLKGKEIAELTQIAEKNIALTDLKDSGCQKLYSAYLLQKESSSCDFLSLMEGENQELLMTIMDKKVDLGKPLELFVETVQKILDRNWMEKREEIKCKIQTGTCSDVEAMQLLKQFDSLKQSRPTVTR